MKTALLIVDMLNDFVNEDGALKVARAKKIMKDIAYIIADSRIGDVQIIYANDSHDEDDVEFNKFPKHCVKGTYGAQVIKELTPWDEDIILEKKTFSAFNEDNLNILRSKGIDRLVIVGIATEYCIKHNVIDAIKNGFIVAVPLCCIESIDEKAGEEAIEEMSNAGVRFY